MILEKIERQEEGKEHVCQGNGDVQWIATIQCEGAINEQRGNPEAIVYHATKAENYIEIIRHRSRLSTTDCVMTTKMAIRDKYMFLNHRMKRNLLMAPSLR